MDILRPGAEGGALLDEAALAAALSSSPPARTTIASALASALVSSGLPSPATLPDPTLAVRLLTAAVCDGALGGALAAALFGPAATGAPPAAAAGALVAAASSPAARLAPAAARALAILLSARLGHPATQPAAVEALTVAAVSAGEVGRGYGRVALSTPPGWLGAVGPPALRAALDAAFLAGLSLVRALAPAAGALAPGPGAPPACPRATVAALDALAHLAFARPPPPGLGTHADLVGGLVSAVAADARAAGRAGGAGGGGGGVGGGAEGVAGLLPPYGDLVAAGPSPPGAASPPPAAAAAPLWLADTILAGRIQFLLHALAACVGGLGPACVEERAAPVALLYAAHPAPLVAAAAVSLCTALAAAGPPPLRPAIAIAAVARCLASPWLDAAPWRPQDAAPGEPDLGGLVTAAAAAVAACAPSPAGRPAAAAASILARCAGAAGGRLAVVPDAAGPAPPGALRALAAAAAGLCSAGLGAVAAGAAQAALASALAAAPPGSRAAREATAVVRGVIAGCDDAMRKPALAGWYQGVAGRACRNNG